MRWDKVPDVHISACNWLEHAGETALLMCFRGFSKSTILGAYKAWRFYCDPAYRVLLQSESDPSAFKGSRHVQGVLRRHPLTGGLVGGIRRSKPVISDGPLNIEAWNTLANPSDREASMQAKGITSNVTGGRADECINDDVEVPRNSTTEEQREKVRFRLGEQVHILVPGGKRKFIGTPHAHDSLYSELMANGADTLLIPLFSQSRTIEPVKNQTHAVAFKPEIVVAGIFSGTRVLADTIDYVWADGFLTLLKPQVKRIDCYAGNQWPERFTRTDILQRRERCRTYNAWDSQYQLHAKPITESRLDPDKLIPYDNVPEIGFANGAPILMLGKTRLVGVKARWDCALGKVTTDASVLAVVFTDAAGALYWQCSQELTGSLEEFDPSNQTRLIGGQVKQLLDTLKRLHVSHITVEVNGPGVFVPAILRKHALPLGVSVSEDHVSRGKNADILDAFEPTLDSGFLWAHIDIVNGAASAQMRAWNAAVKQQPDDHLDCAGRAILETPKRIATSDKIFTAHSAHNVFQSGGVATDELDFSE